MKTQLTEDPIIPKDYCSSLLYDKLVRTISQNCWGNVTYQIDVANMVCVRLMLRIGLGSMRGFRIEVDARLVPLLCIHGPTLLLNILGEGCQRRDKAKSNHRCRLTVGRDTCAFVIGIGSFLQCLSGNIVALSDEIHLFDRSPEVANRFFSGRNRIEECENL